MSDSKKTHILRKLTLGPALILSAIILAVLSLLGLLNFNPPGDGDGATNSEQEQVAAMSETAQLAVSVEPPSTAPSVDVAEPEPLEPLQLVDVLIDGDVYWVGAGKRDGAVVRQSRTIGEITQACDRLEGEPSGVRVRVTRTFEATAQAERALVSALTAAGLTDDEIDLRRTLVERPSSLASEKGLSPSP